jgi:hypothetical protein
VAATGTELVGMRVLAVDDDIVAANGLPLILGSDGAAVVQAQRRRGAT